MITTVLVVDDDRAFRELVVDILASEGYRLLQASDGTEALRTVAVERVDLVLTDQRMPGLGGLELIRRLQVASDAPAVVLMTAYGTIPEAVEAVRLGALDYLTKPLESPAALRKSIRSLLGERARSGPIGDDFLSRDPEMLEMLALADRAAVTDATILITGESGTGKELIARRVHRNSRRSEGSFVAINCAAIAESLAESELFGHEKGAFTGANARHAGRFEQASGGTLFLDEVAELTESVQAKLLRVLEERKVQRVGGQRPVPVNLRLIAATHRDLEAEAREGRFRSDLFYRLHVVSLRAAPLRDRPSDLEILTGSLVHSLGKRLGLPAKKVSPAALDRLRAHSWPGNVRELRNVLERAMIMAQGDEIGESVLPELPSLPSTPSSASPGMSLKERERQAILEALERTGGHREKAAEVLGISVRTLYNRLRDFGIRS